MNLKRNAIKTLKKKRYINCGRGTIP